MKKIGIIAAMRIEVELLMQELKNVQKETIGGTEYYVGKIGGHEVVLMQCGIGKVSAAAGTQAMITRFSPDIIINTGCAGALARELNIGDIVLSSETVEWDMDTTDLGDPRGYIQSLDTIRVRADEKTAQWIASAMPENSTVYKGLVVSGDQFVSRKEQRAVILGSFPDAMCAEMEGAAVGHVCAQNGVPFCVVRCMSDTADGDSGVDYVSFSKAAAEKSAALLIRLMNGEEG